jgi:putative phosphoribosyl transferase
MYFTSRMQAGRMLANQLAPKYRYENCAVVCLSDGGVMVGAQIAMRLHCVMTMLLTSEITLPRENNSIGGITSGGEFSYNGMFSAGELDEMVSEYRGLIDQQKREKMHDMNRLLGSGGMIRPDLLAGHNVILVADGLSSGFALDLAAQVLKPIDIERLIVAVPIASVAAVDRMHILADEIFCLDVPNDFMTTEHYYETQDVPSHEAVLKTIEQIVLQWK